MSAHPRIIGIGAHLPARVLTNAELSTRVETTHEWIAERTGIHQRHIAADGEYSSDLAVKAGQEAIRAAGVAPESIDLLIVATTTPDDTMPSTAVKVQHRLGLHAAAFDQNAACSGFVYAMSTALAYAKSGMAQRILVIGTETYSRILDWADRSTCILFGDGAAAVLLDTEPQAGQEQRGVLSSRIFADGAHVGLLATNGGISTTQTAGTLFMSGKDIFRHAVTKMPAAVEECLKETGLSVTDIDWLVPHQANLRILLSVGQKLGIPEEKLISTVQGHANTSAASIPLALYTAHHDGRLKAGQLVACPALGAGLTWGCTLLRW